MNSPTHLVLSCTNRKHASSASYPRLREVGGKDVAARANAWIESVAGAEPRTPARDLYAGEYWTTALSLAEVCGNYLPIQVWVVSAGLGLVGLGDLIPAYGATLAAGHPDSVVQGNEGREVREQWWEALSAWAGPAGASGPRRLSDLDVDNDSTVILCAGRTYVEAVAGDLVALQARMSDDRLLVLSSGIAPAALEKSWLPVPGQLRMAFGGSMSSTCTRVGSEVIERLAPTGDLCWSAARTLIDGWVQKSAPLPLFDRHRLSDDDVMAWIERDLSANPGGKNRSASLRRLRESGAACEQNRFGRLFALVVETTG